jgi:hypothetical protein
MKLTHRLAAAVALAAPAILLSAAASAAPAHSSVTSAPACGASLETWFAPEGDGFAGGAVYVVEFSNVGGATCTVEGYPTVKLTENGPQVGLKAGLSGPAPAPVTLHQGQTAHVALIIQDAGALCAPVPTDGVSVQAPGSTQGQDFALTAFGACRGKSTMAVDAINPGTGIPGYTIR